MLTRANGRIVGLDHVGLYHRHNGRGGEFSSRNAQSIVPTAGLVAAFDARYGITSAGGFASQWTDLSGNSRHLLQATGANQPYHFPAGTTTSGTAAAGSTGTTLNLAASAIAVNDVYNDMTVTITGGTGSGQSRTITDYAGATKIATVAAWSVTPDNTSTYTIAASRSSVFFDGVAHFMKCSAFTLNQPETVYFVGRQVTWALNDYLYDGTTANTMVLYHATATPTLGIFAGTVACPLSDLAVGAYGVDCAVFNGANSSHQINGGSVSTGNAGTSNAGGFCIGANPVPSLYSNIQAYEILIYNTAHNAATRSNVIRALMSKHGVT